MPELICQQSLKYDIYPIFADNYVMNLSFVMRFSLLNVLLSDKFQTLQNQWKMTENYLIKHKRKKFVAIMLKMS